MKFGKPMQNQTSMTMIWPRLKREVEFQHGGRLFSKREAFVSHLRIELERLQTYNVENHAAHRKQQRLGLISSPQEPGYNGS